MPEDKKDTLDFIDRVFKMVEEEAKNMSEESKKDPEHPMKCVHGHQLEQGYKGEERIFECKECHHRYFPRTCLHEYDRQDVVLRQSIVDNKKSHFTFRPEADCSQ